MQCRASTSRTGAAPRTGMVTATHKKLRLRHITTGQEAHDVPAEHVQSALRIIPGDHVALGDWVGVVESTFEDAMVATPSGLRRVCDVGGILTVGEMEEVSGTSRQCPFRPPCSAARTLLDQQLVLSARMFQLHGFGGGSSLPPMIRRALGLETQAEGEQRRKPVMRQPIVKGPTGSENVHTVLSVKQPLSEKAARAQSEARS